MEAALQLQGLEIITGKNDGNEFYRCISKKLYNGDDSHPKAARKAICSFEKSEPWITYFQLFSTSNFSYGKSIKNLFSEDLKIKEQNFEPPTTREIYAAATMLKIDIYVFCEIEKANASNQKGINQTEWKWLKFSSIDSEHNQSDTFLMFVRFFKNEKYLFSKVVAHTSEATPNHGNPVTEKQEEVMYQRQKSDDETKHTKRPDHLMLHGFPHSQCHSFRFKNAFSISKNRTSADSNSTSIETNTDSMKLIWGKDSDFYETHSFFRCISKELYGTDLYHQLIFQAIQQFELSEDYVGIFSGFTDVSKDASDTEKRTVLKQKLNTIGDGRCSPNEGEIFAAVSILKTPVFVHVSKGTNSKWEMYLPLTSNAVGSSYIALERNQNTYYRLYPRTEECACQVSRPFVMGHVGSIQQNITEYIDQFLAKEKTCCLKSRFKRHIHLDYLVDSPISPKEDEVRNPYLQPIEHETKYVLDILEMENRKLDQIGQGGDTIFHYLSKEIYGTEENFQSVQDQIDHLLQGLDLEQKFQAVSDFVSKPLYVFANFKRPRHHFRNQRLEYSWKCFMPDRELSNAKPDCRYYLTVYYNRRRNIFDRIVPKVGCNCYHRPPVSLIESRTSVSNHQADVLIDVEGNHEPMVEFFLDKLEGKDFQNEQRNIVMPHPFYESFGVISRSDMQNRCIDEVEMDSNSFYRCLSKEIFGTELNYLIIREQICLEMEQCKDVIGHILYGRQTKNKGFFEALQSDAAYEKSQREKAYRSRLELVKSDSEADDVEILAAASFLQTPIYLLSLDAEGNTTWIVFEQLRRKPRPEIMPKRISYCRQNNTADKYYVTILRTSSGHYDRIAAKTEVCNCLVDPPEVPSLRKAELPSLSVNEIRILKIARNVEKCLSKLVIRLNDWLIANEMMIKLCDNVISKLEGTRKNVSVATIAGGTAGIVGGILAIAGLAAGPVTFGASLALTVAGGVIGGVGGLTTTGSKITEGVSTKLDMNPLMACRDIFQKRVEVLQAEMESFKTELQKLDKEANDFLNIKNQDSIDPSKIQSLLGLIRAIKSFVSIPLVFLRISLRAATIANAVLGPLTIVFDIGFMAHAIWNLSQGSKTEVSENLRRVLSQLKAAKTQMEIWAYGNLSISTRNSKFFAL